MEKREESRKAEVQAQYALSGFKVSIDFWSLNIRKDAALLPLCSIQRQGAWEREKGDAQATEAKGLARVDRQVEVIKWLKDKPGHRGIYP